MNRKLFGFGHITALVAIAIVLGAGASQCKDRTDNPKVCSTDASGQWDCPLQTGRQDP
jgi:hypothetical protein